MVQEVAEVGGYICGNNSQSAAIWRPDHDGEFPLISFAHGLTDGGEAIHNYDALLEGVASAGYIIIGNLSAAVKYCVKESED